jgi:anaerobic selenocysteine-containing dehydrogenase
MNNEINEEEIKMTNLTRRNFIQLGIASGALLAAGEGIMAPSLAGAVKLKSGGKDFNFKTFEERKSVPSACWSCATRCAAIGYVENDRLVKIESNPKSRRSAGKMCAKGQSGINDVYFPDRILYPMKRAGKRGEGKWKRISWDDAMTEISGKLKKLRDGGTPEKFMFHYGVMKASSKKLIKDEFLGTYGTGTIGNHTSTSTNAKKTAQELTWGKFFDNWDFDKTNFVLNFGSNVQEAHINHVPASNRLIKARVERGVKSVTFDVRYSNTAALSSEWVPIKPGTDGAVALAMCNVIMQNDLYDKDFFTFIRATDDVNASADDKIAALKAHLGQYTPAWAEKISGVSASKIESLAKEFANAKPAVVISFRGAIAHHNGVEAERAIQMLAAITGNIDNPGGRCRGAFPKWKYPQSANKPEAKRLEIVDGEGVALPTHHVSHQTFKMIKDGKGSPDVYMWYCYNPVYINGESKMVAEVMKDEKLMPFTVASTIVYDESSKLADIILPDATYLERWDWEDNVSPNQDLEFYIRQPMAKPLGESRDFGDVVIDLAEKMGMPLGVGASKEEFVSKSCEMTPGVKEAGGFEKMKKKGLFHPKEDPHYQLYKKEVATDGATLDEKTGVYWKGSGDYTSTKGAYKKYVGQKFGEKVYKGFSPDKLNKTGYFELYSAIMKEKGFGALPTWIPIPEHEKMGGGDLVLTTFKVAVHGLSRTSHRKWISEVHHDNPAWINPTTASAKGINSGDKIKVKSSIGELVTTANVTEKITPGVIAISFHLGREESGRYGSGKKSPEASDNDPDLKFKYWDTYGVNPNSIVPNTADPISGQLKCMDTVVTVSKA